MVVTEQGSVLCLLQEFCLAVFPLKALFVDLREKISPRSSSFGKFPLISQWVQQNPSYLLAGIFECILWESSC